MKLTKSQLRKIIREACALTADQPVGDMHSQPPQLLPDESVSSDVPSPQDYEATRQFMEQNPDIVDMGIALVMDMVGTSCERSTAQAIIDHLQEMIGGSSDDSLSSLPMLEV